MSRMSTDQIDPNGIVKNGFHYGLQVWVIDYIIQDCGHPLPSGDKKNCCNAGYYAGYDIRRFEEKIESCVWSLK